MSESLGRTPSGRAVRSVGQASVGLLIFELMLAFGWFGVDEWNGAQISAVTALVVAIAAVGHNVIDTLREKSDAGRDTGDT